MTRRLDHSQQPSTSHQSQQPRYDLRPRKNAADIHYISFPHRDKPPSPTAVLRHFGMTTYSSFELGRGSFGKVYKAYQGDREVAVKVIKIDLIKPEFKRNFIPQERECWAKFRHRNICELYQIAVCNDYHYYFMIMEFCHNGDLLTYIQTNGSLPDGTGRRWMGSLLDAIVYLHQSQYAHRDIKTENVLISRRNTVKLADFGFACHRSASSLSRTFCGSRSYSSPEVLMEAPYDVFKNDVWCFGIVCFVVMTGSLPFPESFNAVIVEQQRRRSYRWPKYVSAECRETVDLLLTFRQEKRPSAKQAKALPFFNRSVVVKLAPNQKAVKCETQKAAKDDTWEVVDVHEVAAKDDKASYDVFQKVQNFVSKFV